MIKFAGTDHDGSPVFGLGLSDVNLDKLRQGRPISVDLAPMGGRGRVLVFWGATEEDMARDLARSGAVDADTRIHVQKGQHGDVAGEDG